MARQKIACPGCREEVPALDECVKCGRQLPKNTERPAQPAAPPSPAGFDGQPEPAPALAGPRRSGTPGIADFGAAAARDAGRGAPQVKRKAREWRWLLTPALVVLVVASAYVLAAFHIVSGGRFGKPGQFIPKAALSAKNSFVDLSRLDPGPDGMRVFREANPELVRTLRGALLAGLKTAGREGQPLSMVQLNELQACRANQLLIEGARRKQFFERKLDRTDVGTRAFFDDLIRAGYLARIPLDPGRGPKSFEDYRYDAGAGQVTCAVHGDMRRDWGGLLWDRSDYRLIFTTDALPEAGGTATFSEQYASGLSDQYARRVCLNRLYGLSMGLKAYTAEVLQGKAPERLEMLQVRDLVGRGYQFEVPQCPRNPGRFSFELKGLKGDVPIVACEKHRHQYP